MTGNSCATLSECEWPILEPTQMRCATLSTLTELKSLSEQGTRASTTFNGVVSAAVPHVPDVRTIDRFSKCSIN